MGDRYMVVGNPIEHSKSPQIHTLFAEQTGEELSYTKLKVEHGTFVTVVNQFQQAGGRGLNVTVPYKHEAWEAADERSPRAELAGAVNTIELREDGSRFGDNTDGVGLLQDLTKNNHLDIKEKKVLVLGAGGAVRGVLEPLLAERPLQLTIANRTAARAEALAELFAEYGNIDGGGYDELDGQHFDLVINGTAASLQGQLPPLPFDLLAEGATCYDMMYSREPTPFMLWGREYGADKVLDGLGMLVEQAAESFYLWRGVRPETGRVIKVLRGA
ncbi:MAG: shikimate dehydrogenase [Gammaproteobacteria bacterium]|jgi:shikimate dehydrogenase|nr:shikimate dehydrogenase [Gammaproteobacteria bacterium]